MKDRLLTLLLAIGALALFYALMAPKPEAPQERPTRPLSTEQGPNGYLGMKRWLDAAGVESLVLRERYGRLITLLENSPKDNLLISTVPHLFPIRSSEVGPLQGWIASGNTLLVVAGLSDTPDWSMGEGVDADFMEHVRSMTGLEFTEVKAEPPSADKATEEEVTDELSKPASAVGKLAKSQSFELVPSGPHPLLEGVSSVAALSEYPTSQWRASAHHVSLVLELAQNPQSGEPVLWLARYGLGQIIVCAYGSVFTNKLIGESDNARLLANIIERSVGDNGRVVIDDAHQGAVSFYDPGAFFGDKRLHQSIWWLLALWLVFVLGSQRLRPGQSHWNPLDVTSFVRASGGFIARALKPPVAAAQLFENFFNDIRRRIGLPQNGAPLWEWLGSRSLIGLSELHQLEELYAQTSRGRRVDLVRLHNLLSRVRKTLV